jgi:hypothetical protein
VAIAGAAALREACRPTPTTATRRKHGVSLEATKVPRYATEKREKEVPERSATPSSSMAELRRAFRGGSTGNAALPGLGSLCGEDEEIEGLKAELGTQFGRRWCGGERA